MKKKLVYLPEMTGFRGIMASMVCLTHFLGISKPVTAATNPLLRGAIFWWLHLYFTVDAFFVLSGFLITCFLLRDREKPHYFYNFYWRRILRIVPPFLVAVVLFHHLVPHSGKYIVLCCLLVANFSGRFGVDISSGIWTLCIEEQFYLLWPHAVRHLKVNSLARLSIGLIVLSTALRPLVFVLHHHEISIWYTFYRLDGLGLGILAACAYMAREELGPGMRRVHAALGSRTFFYIVFAAFITLFFVDIGRYQEFVSISITNYFTYRFIEAVHRREKTPVLGSRPLLFMGTISYGFYLYHGFVIAYLLERFGKADPSHPWRFLAYGAVIFGISAVAATISLYLIEKPIQHLRKYILKRPAEVHESFATQLIPKPTESA